MPSRDKCQTDWPLSSYADFTLAFCQVLLKSQQLMFIFLGREKKGFVKIPTTHFYILGQREASCKSNLSSSRTQTTWNSQSHTPNTTPLSLHYQIRACQNIPTTLQNSLKIYYYHTYSLFFARLPEDWTILSISVCSGLSALWAYQETNSHYLFGHTSHDISWENSIKKAMLFCFVDQVLYSTGRYHDT